MTAFAGLASAQDFERYYQLKMSGAPSGWMQTSQKTDRGLVTTTNDMTIKIKRGPASIDLTMSSEFIETAEGSPISMKSVQKMGAQPITTSYIFSPSELTTTTEQAGRVSTVSKPLPKGVWLTPAAAGRASREKLAAGAKTIELRTIDPMYGPDPMTITRKVTGGETITINGKPVSATRTTVEASAMPGVPSVEFLDELGLPVRSETTMGGLKMSLVVAGPEIANAVVGEVPEMMALTFIRSSRRIEKERNTRAAVYTITNPDGPAPELPNTSFQSVQAIDEHSARVTLNLDSPTPAPEADAANAEYTGSSALIDAQDEQVKKIATRAVAKLRAASKAKDADAENAAPGKNNPPTAVEIAPMERAEAIRKAVYRHVKNKSFGVGFASASETARSREGDCSEHGVLLAACLRADGIPARVVAGVVYADQFEGERSIFGYHMWVQALIGANGKPCWIDLDATLSERRGFDATHIAMVVSSLADDQPQSSLVGMAATMGTLQIKVESVR